MILALTIVWIVTLAYAIWTDYRLCEMQDRMRELNCELELEQAAQPFQVGDRLDVDADDVPLLTETRVHKMLEHAKDTSRWARSE